MGKVQLHRMDELYKSPSWYKKLKALVCIETNDFLFLRVRVKMHGNLDNYLYSKRTPIISD